jgi:signal transduction histidine kinase
MDAVTGHEERLRELIRAGAALGSELSLDELLQRIVETAATLTGARYAALGVIDPRGALLERFVTTGVDAATQAEIGDFPVGRGILGVLIGEAKPLRLSDLTQDPRSVGFPPGHPRMKTFLGVPIVLRGSAYGNLYLTEKGGGEDFTEEDEEVLMLLAAQAAVAIENTRLHDASRRWIGQLESLAEIGNALVGEMELPRLLQLVVARLREIVGARLAVIILPRAGRELSVEAADGEGADTALELSLNADSSKAGKVMARQRSERIDSLLDDPEYDQASVRLGALAALLVPLVVRDKAIGVLAVFDKTGRDGHFTDADLRLVETYADRAAVAIDLSRRVARESLQVIVRAQEDERKRLARELHDETGQALNAILLGLRSVRSAGDPAELERASEELRGLAVSALEDVRRLAFDLRPSALDDFGLAAALERLVERTRESSGVAVELETALTGRLDDEVETAVYRMVQEALTNVIKHAGAGRVSVVVSRRDSTLTVLVEDDGSGFDPGAVTEGRFGLVAMRERVALLGGRLEIGSGSGSGTTLRATIPLS